MRKAEAVQSAGVSTVSPLMASPYAFPGAILALGFGLSLFAVDTVLVILAFGVLALVVVLLRRPGEPPVFMFAVSFQWLQVSTKLLNATYLGVGMGDLAGAQEIEQALVYSLAGLVALSLGFKLAVSRSKFDVGQATAQFAQMPVIQAFYLYVAGSVVATFLLLLRNVTPGLAQPLLAAAEIKWVVFFVFACAALRQHQHLWLLAAVVAFEIVIGLSGYFSEFKEVLFVGFVAALTVQRKYSGRAICVLALLAAVGISLAVVWTTVKPAYREYLNEGTGRQIVDRDVDERLETLGTIVASQDADTLARGAQALVDRLGYIDYFSYAIRFVPTFEPHANGAMWGAALSHILMPRILFPDKEALPNDSLVTMRYTGVRVHGVNTSVSIGYMGETYIDFGVPGMFVPIFLLGGVYGLMYANILRTGLPSVFAFPAAVVTLLGAYSFETALPKIVGSIIMTFIVMRLLLKFVFPVAEDYAFGRRHKLRAA
ncbi:MAG: hypothetical protein ACT4OU_03215 [Hyphomicrobium sp.]